ncbi:hypothetical protein BA022_08125 [Diaphorobacter nitroreducens]|nr:hypothetical protein BA022_08125 [Diaphorobacter nitroreducens]
MAEEIIRLDAALAAAPAAQSAPQQEPVAWRHSKTLRLYEAKADVPLADGDEWAEPLYLAAPQPAPVAQGDAEQRAMDTRHAAIYRWIIQHTDEAAGIIDAWREDGEADTDELHDALAARSQAKEGGAP